MLLGLFLFSALAKETRTPVYIIDTGVTYGDDIFCAEGHKDFTNTTLEDLNGHGTMVAHLAIQNKSDKYCALMLKWCKGACTRGTNDDTYLIEALNYTLKQRARYLNLSVSGYDFIEEEYLPLSRLITNGAKVFVSSGNDSKNLDNACVIYPACYKMKSSLFHVVGCIEFISKGNYGKIVTNLESCFYNGQQGTSFASPRALNKELP